MELVYIEYFSRRPGVDLETFRSKAAQGQEGWDSGYGEDRLVLALARTWRLGPEPEYLAVWHSPEAGFDRLDTWDDIFRSGEADHLEQPFFQVARIDVAGCYEPLLEPLQARNGVYYIEFFRVHEDLDAVRTFYLERSQAHREYRLNLLGHRIGKLGPEPGGLAVWTLPDFASLGKIAPALDAVYQPIELVTAGTYTDFGSEIL